MKMINCHVHAFTIAHVPHRFLPFRLVQILRPRWIRQPISRLARRIMPFSSRDLLERYVNFMEVTARKTQKEVLLGLQNYYPQGTCFIVLPMDMEYMAAGKVKEAYPYQLEELSTLCKAQPDLFYPFIAVDPRRENVLDLVKHYVEEKGFRGIKLYPPLGYYPSDERLYPVYAYAQDNQLPIMTHCSKGGVYTHEITEEMLHHPWRGKVSRKAPKAFAPYFSEPGNYKKVLEDFPQLKICLAHFGGYSEWDAYLDQPWSPVAPNTQEKAWVSEIVDMMKEYPTLYTDVSYTAFHSNRYYPFLSILLDDPRLKERILFGSDYYMVEREKRSEREMSLQLRYALGQEKFQQISEINTRTYLGIS